jgi:hypothetical protein
MPKLISIFSLLFVFNLPAISQTELNSGGADMKNQAAEISFTFGTLNTQYLENSGFSIIFGVQQPEFWEANITKLVNSKTIKISPNPAGDFFKIINDSQDKVTKIQLFNSAGYLIYGNENLLDFNEIVDISWLLSGAYFVEITLNSKQTTTYKLVKL